MCSDGIWSLQLFDKKISGLRSRSVPPTITLPKALSISHPFEVCHEVRWWVQGKELDWEEFDQGEQVWSKKRLPGFESQVQHLRFLRFVLLKLKLLLLLQWEKDEHKPKRRPGLAHFLEKVLPYLCSTNDKNSLGGRFILFIFVTKCLSKAGSRRVKNFDTEPVKNVLLRFVKSCILWLTNRSLAERS